MTFVVQGHILRTLRALTVNMGTDILRVWRLIPHTQARRHATQLVRQQCRQALGIFDHKICLGSLKSLVQMNRLFALLFSTSDAGKASFGCSTNTAGMSVSYRTGYTGT